MANRDAGRHVTETRTTGWEPGCLCLIDIDRGWGQPPDQDSPPPIPCTVLDPFCGSGTSLLVACRMGRDAIGIELSPDYVKLAEHRIGQGLAPSTYRTDEVSGTLFEEAKR